MKILLLEDEMMLRRTVEEYLDTLGHKISSFRDGNMALESITKEPYDLLILDINVPGISGLELVEKLNALEIPTPVIFISALLDIEEISRAFELGAADYLKKPFHLKELGLRIDRVKREHLGKNPNHVILSEHYRYSKEEQQLYYNTAAINLTKRQLQIVTLLCENMDSVVNFDRFRSFVWNDEPVDNPTIRAEISRFRKSLKEDFIMNVKGVGYKINKYYKSEK